MADPNPYHDGAPDCVEPPDAVTLAEHACRGTLTREIAFGLIGGDSRRVLGRRWDAASSPEEVRAAVDMRPTFARHAAWAVYTASYLDGLAGAIARATGRAVPTVLEVGAGRGLLGPLMRARGIDWICTDAAPPERLRPWHPEQSFALDALDAQEKIPHHLLFWSWWPYKDSTEVTLVARSTVPVIFVGEGVGGCTGVVETWNYAAWDNYDAPPPNHPWSIESLDLPEDVISWDGINDSTWRVAKSLIGGAL